MKTTVALLILLVLFSLNTFAQDTPQWHLPDGAKARLGKGNINEIQHSPDGTRLAVACSIGIWFYDTTTYDEIALLTGRHMGNVRSGSFSPDGNTLASGSWERIHLWDTVTGVHLRTLTGHTRWVESVVFSPNDLEAEAFTTGLRQAFLSHGRILASDAHISVKKAEGWGLVDT